LALTNYLILFIPLNQFFPTMAINVFDSPSMAPSEQAPPRDKPTTAHSTASYDHHNDDNDSLEQVHRVSPADYPKEQRSCMSTLLSKLVSAGLCLIIIGGSIAALIMFYTGGSPASFLAFHDPPGMNETFRWNTNGDYHLHLHILNSLDDSYSDAFDRYISEWNSGSPDVMTLTSERLSPDPSCQPYVGMMNVCNDDFGATGWRGINGIVTENGYIVHSVAKMNDYYLSTEGEEFKLYTMCHEMGHGFGLPHTDEDFYNVDRGDCLDYTTRPQNNLHPGQYNYDLLYEIYGDPNAPDATTADAGTFLDTAVYPGSQTVKKWFDQVNSSSTSSGGRLLGRSRELLLERVQDNYKQVMALLERPNATDAMDEWNATQVKAGPLRDRFDVDLGSGYKLLVQKLLVAPNVE
jgi:hypothetical protein